MTPIPMKNPPKHKIFCKFDPKLIKTGRLKNRPLPPDFDDFWVEFVKYFVFFGIFHGDQGHFYEKLDRFCQKKSKIGKHHCTVLSTGGLFGQYSSILMIFEPNLQNILCFWGFFMRVQ
jgi:hypothetical protein